MQVKAGSRQPTFQRTKRGAPGSLLSCAVHTYASEETQPFSRRSGQTEQLSGERIGELLSAEEGVTSRAASLER
ncbi:hypothetical protein E2C01_007146 [Portunus trituberculatus]|uniref:Uncharacterized protein n=1 Tax=Portunus trituberculatus TaxID=210409 RepID=A0A5B7CXC8_PORTR|nr:hypothetical protein [Portunus trituberculatus]